MVFVVGGALKLIGPRAHSIARNASNRLKDLSNVERWRGHAGTLITDTQSIVTGIGKGVYDGGTNEDRRPNDRLTENDAISTVHKTCAYVA